MGVAVGAAPVLVGVREGGTGVNVGVFVANGALVAVEGSMVGVLVIGIGVQVGI